MKHRHILACVFFVVILAGCIEPEPVDSSENDTFAELRRQMVENHLRARDITDERVLDVMGKIPRHKFVDVTHQNLAYADHPLPIGEGQTISQPYIVALMTQHLELNGTETVLEIGTGSGYQAAVLAEMADEVYTIEIIDVLADGANNTLQSLGYEDVQVKNDDGYFGWGAHAPFDAIIITAAADHVPPPLIEQLKDGGILILPLGDIRYYQTLTVIRKKGDALETEYITSVRFVPMTGEAMGG